MKSKAPEDKRIDVYVYDPASAEVVKIIRNYSSLPIQQITKSIAEKIPVVSVNLKPQDFYSGIKELVDFLALLDQQKVDYYLESDGKPSDTESLRALKAMVSNIGLKDFR